jgi:hypothetical protein
MKKLILFYFFAAIAFLGNSQSLDTLDYVNHFGTVFPVKSNESLSNPELKQLVKEYPEAYKEFKKMRTLKHIEVTLFFVSLVPLTYAIVAENSQQFWIGVGVSGLISGLSYTLLTDPYNRRMKKTIDTYNKLKREEYQKTIESPSN